LKKNILLLGPDWRNHVIEKVLKKKNNLLKTNKKINTKLIINNKIDILITSGYPFLIKEEIIKKVNIAINLHISFLPYGKGIMPNLWSFVENFPAGITIHKLDKNFDTGKILIQKKIYFKDKSNQTLKTTHDYLLAKLEDLFLKNYRKIFNNKIKSFEQNKYIIINRYHTRKESDKIMKKLPKKWNTPIKEILKLNESKTF
jgi:methionyl-tRNA formyltransferase